MNIKNNNTLKFTLAGGVIIALILVFGTIWIGWTARKDTEEAVRSVSLLYLDELAGRRKQVVSAKLQSNIRDLNTAIGLLTSEDLSDDEHLQAYQSRMKKLYNLEKFAFVDSNGLIHTANGVQDNIDDYSFDYQNLTEPNISVLNEGEGDKKVIIAVPVDGLSLGDEPLTACFMEIDMDNMLEGVSLQTSNEGTTFCNIYTDDGVALTDMVLGGLASEDNLLDALEHANFEEGASVDKVKEDFANGQGGVTSFSYNGIYETLDYEPIDGTDWMLTYLIRESVIGEQISSVTDGIVMRSLLQCVATAVVLLGMFFVVASQTRKNARLALEKETLETKNRIKREELEQRLELQEKLLQQEKQRTEQENMITALASDYRSVYYVSLDDNEGICYQADRRYSDSITEGSRFPFYETFAEYAQHYVAEAYREEFLHFIEPDTIRQRLQSAPLIAFRYLTIHDGNESYEMLRMAGVRHIEDREDGVVHAVGVGFSDIDAEMRESMAKNQVLSDALTAAEEASKAKTSFLSSMSHEIRTPMNAIIGLDNIALNDPDISDQTRDYLNKIGKSADHLLSLINDILDMSRIESGRMTLKNEEFSFPKLIEQINDVFSGQCQERNLTYECHVSRPMKNYYIGDGTKLRQVLINILGNAVKFTPEGGTVSLDVECVARFKGKATLQFTISDTGIGISKELMPHIFGAFVQEDASSTSKYGSSGLGLAITKNIVEMMNGDIQVQSEKGVGSTFVVTVTLSEATHDKANDEDEVLIPHKMSVLVIDDDPIACEHARLALEKEGIATDVVQSGAEAIEKVKLRNARRNPYHLILVDWKMPNMDGVETTRRIRAITGDRSAIIILTAYRWDDVFDDATEAGVDSFISKPLFAEPVLEEFKSVLHKREGITFNTTVDLTGKRVLVAEDVDINAEIIQMILEMREVESERVENGKEAVQAFSSHPEGYYDAILMDIRMPEMDGLEATSIIRATDHKDAASIPIVALTANAFDEDVQRSLQAGLNAHLTKPVQPDDLFETLESLIKE